MGFKDRFKKKVSAKFEKTMSGAGGLSKKWYDHKKYKKSELPRADFGAKLDLFESSVNNATSIAAKIKKLAAEKEQLIANLIVEKEKCGERAKEAKETANDYKGKLVNPEEKTVVVALEEIISKIEEGSGTVEQLPTT